MLILHYEEGQVQLKSTLHEIKGTLIFFTLLHKDASPLYLLPQSPPPPPPPLVMKLSQ